MKKITIVPIGGLGNRLLAISSFVTYCRKRNYKLRIAWVQDKGLMCSFSALFNTSEFEDVEIMEISGWKRFIWDFPRKSILWLSPFFHFLLFGKRIYSQEFDIIRSKPDSEDEFTDKIKNADSIYVAPCREMYLEEKLTLPSISEEVKKLYEEIIADFSFRTVGIHIRRTDHIRSIRNNTLEQYIEKMNRELQDRPETTFYIASDSLEEKSRLMALFPGKIITSTREVRRDVDSEIIFALAEIFALAKTKKIYGSKYSTFAIVAGKISEAPIDLF